MFFELKILLTYKLKGNYADEERTFKFFAIFVVDKKGVTTPKKNNKKKLYYILKIILFIKNYILYLKFILGEMYFN